MIDIPMKSKGAVDCHTIQALNHALRSASIPAADAAKVPSYAQNAVPPSSRRAQSAAASLRIPKQQPIPSLKKPAQKGQKLSIGSADSFHAIRACFGWNTENSLCDVDVSAFLLGDSGKVLGDQWFVFYGQKVSPDQSTVLQTANAADREIITVDFDKLNPAVKKIVFVLTIHEAFEKNLNFGMIKDAYIRILNPSDQTEYVSFQMEDYYSNVISMMIGEVYNHNGSWKFNAVGNGAAKDLAGLCTLYGVAVSND